MTWVHAIYLVVGTMCITLGVIHAQVWMRQRRAAGNGSFALLAASAAAMGYVEVHMMFAQSPQAYGDALWWLQVPVWTGFIAMVFFVRFGLRAGRPWLAWVVIGARTLVLVVNFFSTPNIQFREITSLEQVTLFGASLAVGRGVPNPWLALAHATLILLCVFVVDASRDLWRRGERRQAVLIGGGLFLFVMIGTTFGMLAFWGIVRLPIFAMLVFTPVVLVMAYELGLDLIRSAKLAADLKGSEERTALAADAARAGLWSVDRATGRVWATPRALAMFGLASERTHHVDDVLARVHNEDRPLVRDFVGGAENPGSVEYRVADADGRVRWYASLGRASTPDEGAQHTLMGVTIDITDRKQAEDANARQRAEVEHMSRVATLNAMSGALAHELNQPLSIIMSNAEAAQRLLENEPPDLHEIGEMLDDIVAADQRAGEVIQRLRDMLKRRPPDRRPLSIDRVVTDVVHFLRADLVRRGVVIEMALSAEDARVSADRVSLEQVLINVVTNACDAMTSNPSRARIVNILTIAGSRGVEVRIADRGSGLPEVPEQVFAPFYTTKHDGLGMGLAISRSIITAHGGRLTAETNDRGGATFRIDLPFALGAL